MNEVEKRRLIDNVAGLPEAAVEFLSKDQLPPWIDAMMMSKH